MQFEKEQEYIKLDIEMYNLSINVYDPGKRKPVLKICATDNGKRYGGNYSDIGCGVEFEAVYVNQKYCPECSTKRELWYVEKLAKELEEEIENEQCNWATASIINNYLDIEDGEVIEDRMETGFAW